MRKKIISLLLVATMLVPTSLTGCGTKKGHQKESYITVELGDNLDFDLNDIYEVEGGLDASDVDVDASEVNTKEIGKYVMVITFHKGVVSKDEKRTEVGVWVVDTTAPTLAASDQLNDGITYMNDITDFSKYFKATDLTDTHIEAEFAMLGEAEALSEEVINNYKAKVTEEAKVTEAGEDGYKEGYYRATAYGVDTSDNKSEGYSWLVVYDKTAPEVYVDDKKVSDGDSVDYTVDSIKNHISIKDNFSANLEEMASLTEEDGKIVVSVMDTCGNETKLTLNGKKSSGSNSGSRSGGSSSSSSSSSNKSNSGSKNNSKSNGKYGATTPEGYPLVYFSDGSGVSGYMYEGYYCDVQCYDPNGRYSPNDLVKEAVKHIDEVYWHDGKAYYAQFSNKNADLTKMKSYIKSYCESLTGRTDIIEVGWDSCSSENMYLKPWEENNCEFSDNLWIYKGVGFEAKDADGRLAWYDIKPDGSYVFQEYAD